MSEAMVEITERFLSDTGGWQALKQARTLVDAGRVSGAAYAPPLLKGTVRDGSAQFRAGLKIASRTQVENLCTCRAAREWGTVCAHSLAVGLAFLREKNAASQPTLSSAHAPFSSRQNDAIKIEGTPAKPHSISLAGETKGPHFSETTGSERVKLHVILTPNFDAAFEKNSVTAVAEIEDARGRRQLANTLDKNKTFACAAEDIACFEKLRALNSGELPAMMILTRAQCIDLLESLRGHPRVTFGKKERVDIDALLGRLGAANESRATSPAVNASSDPQSGADVFAQPHFLLSLEGSLNHLTARLQCVYEDRVLTIGSENAVGNFPTTFPDPENPQRRLSRNFAAEREAADRLDANGFSAPNQASGERALKGERAILSFFATDLPRLQREWKVSIGSRFASITESIERIAPRVDIQSSGENWFDLDIALAASGGETISRHEIQRLLQSGQNHLRLKNNRIAVFDGGMLDDLQNALADCDPRQLRPGAYRLDRAHAGYIDEILRDRAEIRETPAWKQWTEKQRLVEKIEPLPLGSLEHILRPYQKQGVYWLSFLARNGLGGILADEMGLGKTLQTLAFLQQLQPAGAPSLIVCPSSLVSNWQREAQHWTPSLRTLVLEGAKRAESFSLIAQHDVVITSYALLRRDIERYRREQFTAVILDEAQHIKNPETQNAQSAGSLKACHRFVLTGTPMENSVRDIWSLMNFVMPGYLGSRTDFRERYEEPINHGHAEAVQSRLVKRLKPFFLRRRKQNVATDLPEKIEQVTYCELTKHQADVYQKLLEQSRTKINELSGEKDKNRSRMLMLTALLRLRQICCDVRLLNLRGIPLEQSSAKLDLLDELLREAIDGNHRVLIFSQFVTMLRLIETWLDDRQIHFCSLYGETSDRQLVIDEFQNNYDIPVFLLSLKAGGVGLNLTAADTVIHFDPWWNPAVEAQATDRAHRIGQKNIVTSYKLITRGTVEEKILRLQQAKKTLTGELIENEEQFTAKLSIADIENLFE